jgi:hypothetical protein
MLANKHFHVDCVPRDVFFTSVHLVVGSFCGLLFTRTMDDSTGNELPDNVLLLCSQPSLDTMKSVSEQGESDIIISPAPLHPIVVIER